MTSLRTFATIGIAALMSATPALAQNGTSAASMGPAKKDSMPGNITRQRTFASSTSICAATVWPMAVMSRLS